MANRTILIGDLHGSLEEALELLNKCEATAQDWVIFLGDLIDRGPDSAGCVDLAMRLQARQGRPSCVMGNHEERHLDYEDIKARLGRLPHNMNAGHLKTRQQLRPEHYDYMRRMPTYIRLPEHNAVAVHAGVYPGRKIEEQTIRHLLHIQSICPPEEKSLWPSKVPANARDKWRFWTNLWDGHERIFFGHSVLDKPLVTDKVVGLDGGACFGRELWAFVLPDQTLVSVKGRARRRDDDRGRDLIKIHGDVGAFS